MKPLTLNEKLTLFFELLDMYVDAKIAKPGDPFAGDEQMLKMHEVLRHMLRHDHHTPD